MEITPTIHNPDRYMADLRQILSQGRKRIGIVIGAGAPTSIRVDKNNQLTDNGNPLIPNVDSLTHAVINALTVDAGVICKLKKQIEQAGSPINIETILTQVRRLSQAIGPAEVYGLDGPKYDALAKKICKEIGKQVSVCFPPIPNPYTELILWVSGTIREHQVEIFTPNYDFLIEEAFEHCKAPYFDGFIGSCRPFFDAASISPDKFPTRWSFLWKLHGSLGWKISDDTVERTGKKEATELIYPDHLKYDQVTRQPYSALFERLRQFLLTPDTLLICTGFSFRDSHICAVLDEALDANRHTAIYAFQYQNIEDESAAVKIARRRPNMSVYARDKAFVSGVEGLWRPGASPNENWPAIRETFWQESSDDDQGGFMLGDFAKLSRFLALIQAPQIASSTSDEDDDGEDHERPPIGSGAT